MKRTKAQPSLVGLFLLVGGMLLISMVLLSWAGGSTSGSNATLIGLSGAGLVSLVAGAILTGGKRR